MVAQDKYQVLREKMVREQLEGRGIEDEATLGAMRTVKRHLFVPENLQRYAYRDSPLPIGNSQTISQPYMVAYMTEAIEPKPYFKVLEVGTGCGYQAAVLAEIVAEVYTIEIVEELGKRSAKRLKDLGYANIEVRIGDGYYGWPEHAPFDAIIVTAGAEKIPPLLLDQLKDGGKMVIPIGDPEWVQTLMLAEKRGKRVIKTELIPVRFVPFTREKH